jgi:hypothetical protein
MEHWWNDKDMGKSKYLVKTLSQCHLSSANPTQTGLGPNLGFQDKKLVPDHLNHAMA